MTTTEHRTDPDSPPVPQEKLAEIAAFVFELGVLKRLPRTGWCQAGVPMPESVADHSWRVAQIAGVLAVMEGADPARATLIGAWHDVPEARLGDLPHSSRDYLPKASPRAIIYDQLAGLNDPIGVVFRIAIDQFETGETLEAQCARDADKLDCLYQALEYQNAGHKGLGQWIDTSLAALKLPSAQALGEAALRVNPMQWRANG